MTPVQPRPEHLLNREIGFIAFNRRILELAQDAQVPLLERLRYLCIVSSNLDEFFMVNTGLAARRRSPVSPISNAAETTGEEAEYALG